MGGQPPATQWPASLVYASKALVTVRKCTRFQGSFKAERGHRAQIDRR